MPNFDKLFRQHAGKPFDYHGKTVMRLDRISVQPHVDVRMRFRIVTTNSNWVQGFRLITEGHLSFTHGDSLFEGTAYIWEDSAPTTDEFACFSESGQLRVLNTWRTSDGTVFSAYNGAAMWKEEIPNGWRYHCNDGHPDDDFDDIIFEIVRIDGEK